MVTLTTDELYGAIGAVIAGVIAIVLKVKGLPSLSRKDQSDSSSVVTEVKHIREIIDNRFTTQTQILDEKLENLDTNMERIEDKMVYVNENVEAKINELSKNVNSVSSKLERLQDRFFDHLAEGKK